MKIRIKLADGTTKEVEIAKRADGGFICPCCMKDIGAMACPKCSAEIPPNYCLACGCYMGGTCLACGQPSASNIASMAEDYRGEQHTAAIADALEIRATEFEGIVEAYASSEVKDSHGTIIDPNEVLLKAAEARIDQMHDEQPVEGVSLVEARKVLRNVDGTEIECVKTTLRFDLAVAAARAAFEKIRDGTYKGLSIGFFIAKSLGEKLKAGVTDVIDRIESIPFISLVDRPSNGMALIENYRRAPEAPAETKEDTKEVVSTATDELTRMGAALEGLYQEPPNPPAPPATQPEARACSAPAGDDEKILQLRSEMTSQIEQVAREIRGIIAFLNEKITPAFEHAKRHADTEVSTLRRAVEGFEDGIRKWVQSEIARLRVAKPKREVDLDNDPMLAGSAAETRLEISEPVSFPPRFGR